MNNLESLKSTYASMPDFKLIRLASTAFHISKEAQELLRAEFIKRNIEVELITEDPDANEEEIVEDLGDTDINVELVVIAFFNDYYEAVMAKNILESENIYSFISDVNTNFSNLLGIFKSYGNNNRLSVSSNDVHNAINILRDAGYGKFLS